MMLMGRRQPNRHHVLWVLISLALLQSYQTSCCSCWAFVFFQGTSSSSRATIIISRSVRHYRLFSKRSSSTRVLLAAKKSKGGGGMAEKRARRQARQQRNVPTDHLPKANLSDLVGNEDKENNDSSVASAAKKKTTVKTTTTFEKGKRATMTKAQELLARQRESLAMLALVREKMEALPVDEISAALHRDGFYVHDNLLIDQSNNNNDSNSHDDDTNSQTLSNNSGMIFEQMQKEGLALLETSFSQPDVNYLASGEYICNLQGGEDQYKTSPSSIEWVVSVTKHLPELFKKNNNNNDDTSNLTRLDTQKCIGYMRTFDRKARIAARKLLAASTIDNDDGDELAPRSFGLAATNGASDLKQLSMRYYLVPKDWDSLRHGGGLAFYAVKNDNHNDNEIAHVDAVCDRLVLWKSHETRYQAKPWFGDAQHESASCIELHLLRKE